MSVIQDWNGNSVCLKPGTYFHWVSPGSFLLHNAKVGKGIVTTVSTLSTVPGLGNATTLYAAYNVNPKKELEWERVRAQSYPLRPTRMKALFCFDEQETALRAQQRWFSNENRRLIQIRLTEHANS